MTNTEFVKKLVDIATNYKTLYVMGCFGAPMTASNKTRYCTNHSYNKAADRIAMINAASADTFGFDCVCLIKGVLWGWNGDKSKTYGGATYASNGVPDIGADSMITMCKNISTDFSNIEVGEAVWMSGHIGIYAGDGKVVECSPKWSNNVQISNLGNITKYKTGNYRIWTKHGKLPYITYAASSNTSSGSTTPSTPSGSTSNVTFKVGDKVKITGTNVKYNPESTTIPDWVKNDYTHIITQVTSNGKAVTKGGKTCVLLGKKIKNGTTKEEAGVNTWVSVDILSLVGSTATTKTHTVVKGDTLWQIAKKYLGNGARYTEIKKLNGLTSDVIKVGQVLKIPS